MNKSVNKIETTKLQRKNSPVSLLYYDPNAVKRKAQNQRPEVDEQIPSHVKSQFEKRILDKTLAHLYFAQTSMTYNKILEAVTSF